MIRRPPRSTQSRSSAASDVYKRQSPLTCRKPTRWRGVHLANCEFTQRKQWRSNHERPTVQSVPHRNIRARGEAVTVYIPYPNWLNTGDNTWQIVAATLVGLMSLPGIAVLYGGLVQKKWAVNTMLMAFTGFGLVLIVWVLWAFNMSFGVPSHFGGSNAHSFLNNVIGHPVPAASHFGEQNQEVLPEGTLIPFHYNAATFIYFQVAVSYTHL